MQQFHTMLWSMILKLDTLRFSDIIINQIPIELKSSKIMWERNFHQ